MALVIETLPSWQHVWRNGFAPLLTTAELVALATGLREDDERLIQDGSSFPDTRLCNHDQPIQAGCPLSYAIWQGRELETVGDVHEAWADLCFEADQRLGEPAECRWLLNWLDDSPRETVRRELLAEVERELDLRRRAA